MSFPSPWPSPRASLRGEGNTNSDPRRCFLQINLPVCVPRKHSGLVAGFKTHEHFGLSAPADLETPINRGHARCAVGDTVGLETYATVRV